MIKNEQITSTMRNILTYLISTFLTIHSYGQVEQAIDDSLETASQTKNISTFENPEVYPVFRNGGDIGLKNFINENLHYPNEQCLTGKVIVGFTVDMVGNVKDVEIKRGITKEANEEAIRIVNMLTFFPGTRFGKPIDTRMILPISFTLE